MDYNVNQIVRSCVVALVGLPLTAAVFIGVSDSVSKSAAQQEIDQLKAELTIPCIQWSVTKPDTGLERDAKDSIDEVLGGDGIDYKGLCGWVL
jgi:hypothetical protein